MSVVSARRELSAYFENLRVVLDGDFPCVIAKAIVCHWDRSANVSMGEPGHGREAGGILVKSVPEYTAIDTCVHQ